MVNTRKNRNNMFIFGYGSLMNNNSRKRTLKKNVKGYPTILRKRFGYKKKFNTIAGRHKGKEIVIGIEKNPKKTTSVRGVLFPVNKLQLNKLNKREGIYKRIYVPHKYIKSTLKLSPNSRVYTYRPIKIQSRFNKTQRIYKNYKYSVERGNMQLFGKKM